MEITKAVTEDLPGIIEMWKGQYDYHHTVDDRYYVPFTPELELRVRDYLEKAISTDSPHILVAKDGRTLGFITFTEDSDEYLDANIPRFGLVIELYIAAEARGLGVGKALMVAAENAMQARGLTHMKLSCSTFNTNALDFYKHLGYVGRQEILIKEIK